MAGKDWLSKMLFKHLKEGKDGVIQDKWRSLNSEKMTHEEFTIRQMYSKKEMKGSWSY